MVPFPLRWSRVELVTAVPPGSLALASPIAAQKQVVPCGTERGDYHSGSSGESVLGHFGVSCLLCGLSSAEIPSRDPG